MINTRKKQKTQSTKKPKIKQIIINGDVYEVGIHHFLELKTSHLMCLGV